MRSKLEIYALSVCFAAVIGLVISIGIAGYSLFEIAAPELTMSAYTYNKYQSNDAFWRSKETCYEKDKPKVRPSEEELTKQRLDAFASEVRGEQRGGVQTLIRCFMFILVSGIALLIHWKIAKKTRETST
jgi:hypothetical protein